MVLGLLCMVATGCGRSESHVEQDPPQQAGVRQTVQPDKPVLFDAQGRLKPSGRMLHWFDIPMGFENRASWSQHHVFESREVPVDKLREYLGARMLTGQVQELGQGALYRRVMPLSAEDSAMRFDMQVTVTDQGRLVRLDVDELLFPGVEPLSSQQAAAALKQEQARAD